MAAALAMGAAAEGARVAVVTIDPARRLANSLGLDELGNEPALIDPERFTPHGVEMRGELWAMMLDAKRTFDEVIERLAPDAATRDEVLGNRIYQQLSTAVAGSQEFTAIAKLYELDEEGDWDLLVLDTPPSRNALDFLDAPGRLTHFFQGPGDPRLPAPHGAARSRDGDGVLDPQTGHRRRPAAGPLGVLPRARRHDRRLRRPRAAGRRAPVGPGDDVPDRHLARARAGRGGDLLPPQAARRADAVRRPGRQPRPRGAGGRRRAARGARRGAGRQARRAGRHLGARGARRSPSATSAASSTSPRSSARRPRSWSRSSTTTSTTSAGSRE